ncbi:P-loop NTPase fold protein [Amycolatopsis sp. NPDC051371]|uniref:P-loop NTPase fold protein n=1 Tax=Amycolatopsis sp. NPDC051371 TaxID=3155800 RepID=UPI0034260968
MVIPSDGQQTAAEGADGGFDEDGFTVHGSPPRRTFTVLNDAPVGVSDDDDLLGAVRTGRRLAQLLVDSRDAAPFTLAIDAAWGTGKSSLLHAVDRALSDTPGVRTVWFNAWTAERVGALEGLIKSVLLSFDRNVLRRAVRKLAGQEQLLGVLRAAVLLAVSVVGLGRVVDELWRRLAADAKSRNQIRDVVRGMAENWLARSRPDETRLLAVFVDDLDRCSSAQIVEVCEAMKLYLDVPGVVFVLACDGAVVLRAVRDRPGGDREGGEIGYLDKIIQINYRVAPPSERRALRLIGGYAARSGTADLFDVDMRSLLVEHTGGNPRAIKRLINSFVLEYRLRPDWDEAGAQNLLKIILLQQFYPVFYSLFVDSLDADPIGDFLAYREFRLAVGIGDLTEPDVAARTREFFVRKHIAPPEPHSTGPALDAALHRLEQRLPPEFVRLGDDTEFTSLLAGLVGPVNTSLVRAVLHLRPLASAPIGLAQNRSAELAGTRILWVDDEANDSFYLAQEARARGARVAIANDGENARLRFELFRPTVLVSDIHRNGDDEAGFTDLEAFRARRLYDGPVIFFTRTATEARQQRATALGARITDQLEDVLAWLPSI